MIYGLRGNNQGLNECVRVYLNASFTMKGGSIVSGYCKDDGSEYASKYAPGGVYVDANSTFNMTGGRIIDCSTGVSGGGVVINGGEFNMSGGSIENCRAADDGGVYIWAGKFNMTGGTITGCTANEGSGVYVANGATATLIPENITGNTKKGSGETNNIVGSYQEYIPPVDPIDPDYPLISILPVLAKDLLFIDVKSTDWFYSDVKYA